MLSSAASLLLPRAEIPQPRRRVPVREKNPNLFDLLLDETYLWETLDEEQKKPCGADPGTTHRPGRSTQRGERKER